MNFDGNWDRFFEKRTSFRLNINLKEKKSSLVFITSSNRFKNIVLTEEERFWIKKVYKEKLMKIVELDTYKTSQERSHFVYEEKMFQILKNCNIMETVTSKNTKLNFSYIK